MTNEIREAEIRREFTEVYMNKNFTKAKKINHLRYNLIYNIYEQACRNRRKILSQNFLRRRLHRKELRKLNKEIINRQAILLTYEDIGSKLFITYLILKKIQGRKYDGIHLRSFVVAQAWQTN